MDRKIHFLRECFRLPLLMNEPAHGRQYHLTTYYVVSHLLWSALVASELPALGFQNLA